MTPPLYIHATGMCCAVGYSTAAASAAMGACVDHFTRSWFQASDGSPLVCAMVWGLDVWGPERMGALFGCVLEQCREETTVIPERTALVLLVPDSRRPGAESDWPQEIYEHCVGELSFHAASRICPWDRAGLGPALRHAREVLQKGVVDRVLLAGVDSYLNAITLNAFLDAERLLVGDISDGFIPGEGAGAVVLGLEAPAGPCVRICGVGCGEEAAHIVQDAQPNRATGLTQAIREAVAESGRPLADMQFHFCDGNGNTYYAAESSLALTRTLEHPVPDFPYILPASYFGETGAAVGPLMLAYLSRYMPREGLGYGLVHTSADHGQRSALLVEYV